ncbi:flavin reductase family protein [Actinomadura sp. 9N407]|uniref:flavin reductase family protein n=1 Tax=Actinomadura sp. 9N407 TaxID=3375154 RepID=UPI003790A169
MVTSLPAAELAKSWWRTCVGQYPTGVTLITTVDGLGAPTGIVVGTFTSVSEDPPLVGFLATSSSQTLQQIRRSGRFRVSVLGAGHEELCQSFVSGSTDECFAEDCWNYDEHGMPRLRDAVAWFDTTVHDVLSVGDREFVLGRVHDLGIGDGSGALPLLFLKGGYGSFPSLRLDFDARQLGGRLRLASEVTDAVAAFADRMGVECLLATVAGDSVVVLTAANARAQLVGMTFPFAAPMAPGFAAWSDEQTRGRWMRRARRLLGNVDDEFMRETIDWVREYGYALSFGDTMSAGFDAVMGSPEVGPDEVAELWAQVAHDYRMLSRSEFPERHVSMIQAPVFDRHGTAELEVVVGGFGPGCAPERYQEVVVSTLDFSAELTRMVGGTPPDDYAPRRP